MKEKNATTVSFNSLSGSNYASLTLLCLYVLVDFIPRGESIDFNGPQWLYLSIINLITVAYLFSASRGRTNEISQQFTQSISQAPALMYTAFCILSGLSFFFAFNKNEFVVCYARCVIAFIAFANMVCLLRQTNKIVPFLAQVVSLVLLYNVLSALKIFFNDVGELGFDAAVLNMKGVTGNKNIFASAIVVKLPFDLYCVFAGTSWKRIINLVILFLALYAIALANARSSYIGILFQLIVFLAFCIYEFLRHQDARKMLQDVSLFLIPIVLAVMLSQITVETQRRNIIDGQQTAYGTVTEKISSIGFTNQSSSGRLGIWAVGIDLFKHYPLTGRGYGNWKITSQEFDQFSNDDNSMSVHAHNDFIEAFGESGILGGIAYLLVFILLPFYSLKNLLSASIPRNEKIILLLSLIGLAGYFTDAFLNFPMERATMQTYFFLLYAINAVENARLKKLRSQETNQAPNRLKFILPVFLLLTLGTIYVTYQTNQSMIIQSALFEDVNADVVSKRTTEINDQLPSLTNVTMWGLPLSLMKGRYLLNEKRIDEGMAMFENVRKENPYMYYAEFIKGRWYYENGYYDSAYKYGVLCFEKRPRNVAYFGLLAFVCANKNDSGRLFRNFNLIRKYRNDEGMARGWNNYLYALQQMKYPTRFMSRVADSALALFPKDSVTVKNSLKLHKDLGDVPPDNIAQNPALQAPVAQPGILTQQQPGAPPPPGTPGAQPAPTPAAYQDSLRFYDFFKRGNEAFTKNDLKTAMELYESARKINPKFSPIIENIGLVHFLNKEWGAALPYFERVVNNKWTADGKAEYYRGICLYNVGKVPEGCQSFLTSEAKGYSDARRLYNLNCVNPPGTPPPDAPNQQE
ncbi:MAG: O-antigen ligase family protein [Bacteroidota bacterium]